MAIEDLPDEEIQRLLDYSHAAGLLTNGRHDFRIPILVAEGWAERGYAVLPTNTLARMFGSTRRTMCSAIKRLLAAGAIREIGRTENGHPMLAPVLEIGDKWREAREAYKHGAH